MPLTPERPESLLHAPFRGADAVAAGLLTRRQLQRQAWRSIFRGIYVAADLPDTHQVRCQAMALLLPDGAVISGRSAARMWGVSMGGAHDPVAVLSPSRMRQVTGSLVRVGRLQPSEVVVRHGVPVPTRLHTAWEVARDLNAIEAVPWVDALARRHGISTARLVEHCAEHAGEIGSADAFRTLGLGDWRAESPPESIVRVSLVVGGLPVPIPQYRVVVDRQYLARVDLAYPKLKLALEYDGQWHADRDQLTRDRRRIRNLNAAGWYVYPITRHDLRNLPALVASVRQLIIARSAQRRSR